MFTEASTIFSRMQRIKWTQYNVQLVRKVFSASDCKSIIVFLIACLNFILNVFLLVYVLHEPDAHAIS